MELTVDDIATVWPIQRGGRGELLVAWLEGELGVARLDNGVVKVAQLEALPMA